jgi:hypothetical protein
LLDPKVVYCKTMVLRSKLNYIVLGLTIYPLALSILVEGIKFIPRFL